MKKFRKVFTFLLGGVMMCSMFAGCGGNKVSYDPDNFIADTSNPQIVKEKVTIKMFVPKHALHSAYGDMRLFREMEEITNIHVDFVEANTESYQELRSGAWDDTSIDAFLFWNTLEEQTAYASAGLIQPIGDLIDLYAPNYKKMMDENPEIEKRTTLGDGKIYSFASINTVPRDLTFKQFINQKWLDALGLDMPTTIEEFYDVLVAFKTQDPNGNGFADEIPLSSVGLNQTRNFLMSAFGYVSTGIEVGDDGKVVFVPATENYWNYIQFANKLYTEGLLDKDVFSMNADKDLAQKGSQNILGCFDGGAAYLIVGNNLDPDYTGVPALTSAVNDKQMWLGFGNEISPDTIVIKSTSPYQKEIVRWMDFFYTELGTQLESFGKEGVDWTWDNEEHTSWTFNVPEGMDIEEYRGTITPNVGLGTIPYWCGDFVLKDSTPQVQNINKAVEEAGYMDYLKVPYPSVTFTADESVELSTLQTDLNNLVESQEASLIAKKNLTREDFDKFQSSLKDARVARYVEIYQAAYDRYMGK